MDTHPKLAEKMFLVAMNMIFHQYLFLLLYMWSIPFKINQNEKFSFPDLDFITDWNH